MTNSSDICDTDALRACVGKTPASISLKVIDHIDPGCTRFLQAASLSFIAFGDENQPRISLAGGKQGFASAAAPEVLHIPAASLDSTQAPAPGAGFGSLFLVPGLGETLRINGRVGAVESGLIAVDVEECYLHCAKALIRSSFWKPEPGDTPEDATGFVAGSRFLALATMNAAGDIDVSPKGDPAGALLQLDGTTLHYPDRPGNRRVDSFRNLIEQPNMTAIALIPGQTRQLCVSGRARISQDAELRARFAVRDRTPKLVTRIAEATLAVNDSAALQNAQLWPAPAPPKDIDPAALFVAHVKLNKDPGTAAKVMRSLANRTAMKQGLKADYKTRLY